jgi:hypothetical protein
MTFNYSYPVFPKDYSIFVHTCWCLTVNKSELCFSFIDESPDFLRHQLVMGVGFLRSENQLNEWNQT